MSKMAHSFRKKMETRFFERSRTSQNSSQTYTLTLSSFYMYMSKVQIVLRGYYLMMLFVNRKVQLSSNNQFLENVNKKVTKSNQFSNIPIPIKNNTP